MEGERIKSEKERLMINLVTYRRMEHIIVSRQRDVDAKLGLPGVYYKAFLQSVIAYLISCLITTKFITTNNVGSS